MKFGLECKGVVRNGAEMIIWIAITWLVIPTANPYDLGEWQLVFKLGLNRLLLSTYNSGFLGGLDSLVPFRGRSQDLEQYVVERQRYDGWYNNMAYPEWGSTDSRLTRKTPPAYEDGVYMMAGSSRPNPLILSQTFMRGTNGLKSVRNRTALLAFFGQLVSGEILLASENGCPLEIFKIPVKKCDETYDKDCTGGKHLSFYRANYDQKTGQSPNMPREQVLPLLL